MQEPVMSSTSAYCPVKSVGMTVLSLALLSGCATQEAVTEQIDPLGKRVSQMEASLQASSAAQKAQEEAIARQLESLWAEFKALQAAQDENKERVAKAELRLDELATVAGEGVATSAVNRTQMEAVEARMDELGERVTKADLRLDELATTTGQASEAAALAQQGLAGSADSAVALGERLAQTEKRVDVLSAQVQEALAASRQDYIRQHGKVAAIVLLTEDKTLYPINSPELGAGDRAKLDDLASRVKGTEEEYHLDIQGHTDNIGTDDMNYALGRARAEVVKRYLHERAGVPLSRMSTISYGATQPVTGASGGNRRIVINLLVLEKK